MFDKKGGTVKFIDFGLACQLKAGSNEVAGTPYYLAPEVLTGFYGFECDIWSLGVVLYQLMSGRMPFVGNSSYDLFRAIKEDDVDMPYHFNDNLKDLIEKMLKKNPKERITPKDALNHPWIKSTAEDDLDDEAYTAIMNRL